MTDEWREARSPLETDGRKSFSRTVPWIVVVFARLWAERVGYPSWDPRVPNLRR
jgi:hypothetical protein